MLTAICDVMAEAYKRGWITTRDGNCAVSRNKQFYITPSSVRKNVLRVEDIVRCRFSDNEVIDRTNLLNPSIEFESHARLHQIADFSPIATLHLHPTHTVAAMYAGIDLSTISTDFPELNRYTRVGKTVEMLAPGTDDLAENVLANMTETTNNGIFLIADIVGQKGHGVMAIGKDPWAAFEHVERLEHICQIILKSR